MKKRLVYFMNAFYCIVALVVVAGALVEHHWMDALMLFVIYLFVALYDWERYKYKRLLAELADVKYKYDKNSFFLEKALEECVKAKERTMMIFNCDHCPRETPTCKKLIHETFTECVDNIKHFDL